MISIQDQVIQDIESRKEIGLKEYGTLLYSDTKGDMLQHLYEELLDAACYIKTLMARREDLKEALINYQKYPKLDVADWVAGEAQKFIEGIDNDG